MLHRSRVVEARILAIVLGSLAVRTTSLRTTVGTALVAPWDQNMENGTRTASCASVDTYFYLQLIGTKQFYVHIFIKSHLKSVFVSTICRFNIQLGPSHDFAKAQIQAKVVLHGAPMSGRDLVGSQAFSGSESRARIQRCTDIQFKTLCKHRN